MIGVIILVCWLGIWALLVASVIIWGYRNPDDWRTLDFDDRFSISMVLIILGPILVAFVIGLLPVWGPLALADLAIKRKAARLEKDGGGG